MHISSLKREQTITWMSVQPLGLVLIWQCILSFIVQLRRSSKGYGINFLPIREVALDQISAELDNNGRTSFQQQIIIIV